MFKLDRKLDPDEFIQTFSEVNKNDHQRPPHPWETLFREGKCTREQLQGWAKERYYFVKTSRLKNTPSFITAHIPKCAGCGCPKPSRKRVRT